MIYSCSNHFIGWAFSTYNGYTEKKGNAAPIYNKLLQAYRIGVRPISVSLATFFYIDISGCNIFDSIFYLYCRQIEFKEIQFKNYCKFG